MRSNNVTRLIPQDQSPDNHYRWTKAGCSDWLAAIGPKLKSAQLRALFFLSRYADENTGECYPSLDTLAEDSGMDRSEMRRRLIEVAELGHIRMEGGKQGSGHVMHYWLTIADNVVIDFQKAQAKRRGKPKPVVSIPEETKRIRALEDRWQEEIDNQPLRHEFSNLDDYIVACVAYGDKIGDPVDANWLRRIFVDVLQCDYEDDELTTAEKRLIDEHILYDMDGEHTEAEPMAEAAE